MQRVMIAAILALPSVFSLSLVGCSGNGTPAAQSERASAVLFEGMGAHTRPVSCLGPMGQRYFDQGLTWMYGFNHDEAIRSFEEVTRLDPECAMGWWGVAIACGPHINNMVMSPERSKQAWEATQRALALSSGASQADRALIEALASRYAWPAPEDRRALEEAYAKAMAGVYERFPSDQDVATLYAESMMDLAPWDLYTLEGDPKPGTERIVEVIEGVLAVNPRHPGAAHLYIHAVEASRRPERAVAAADVLRDLVPASGHLRHMPSHIDIRIGEWEKAAVANRKAVATDAAYRALSPDQGFYHLYMMHDGQFLSFVSMMRGRSEEAISSGKAAVEGLPKEMVKAYAGVIDGYMTVHMDALKRFGKWDEILALKQPPSYLPLTTAMWRCNRAIAYAAKGELDRARRERERFVEACGRVPEGQLVQINPADRVLKLALHVVDGEIAYIERDYSRAEEELRAAMAIEDTLLYMEPPDWMVPVRHTLGTVQIDAGRFADAEQTYREDLVNWPENGWSLLGLAKALEAQGKSAEAAEVRKRHAKVWAGADIAAHASCLCAPKGS